MNFIHLWRRRAGFPGLRHGMSFGLLPCMAGIRELVEHLPECEPKGALRGLATAAGIVPPAERAAILERMAVIVRRWREQDPLASLDAELGRELEQHAGRG